MQATPYLPPLLITALLALVLALVIWRRRQAPGAPALGVLVLAVALWALAYMLSLASPSLEGMLWWANVAYLGIVLVPASWLAFAVAYTGHDAWLSRRRLALLAVMPLATLAAVWTNDLHRLFRTDVYLVRVGSSTVLEADLGPLFWVHTAYSYLLLLAGSLLLVRSLFQMAPSYRAQAGGLFVGLIAPWVGNAIYLSGLSPFPYLDLTPFALGVSGVALTWDLLRFGLFELVPIARNAVFQSIDSGVIVLDGRGRIVDINPAALGLTRRSAREAIGRPIAEVFAGQADLVQRYRQVRQVREELLVEVAGEARAFDLRISPVLGRAGELRGRVIVLHDVTELRRATAELQRQNQELAELASANAELYRAVQLELAERRKVEASLSLAKEAAEVASRAKSRFLGNMSHELRTPLTAILGYADLLEMDARHRGDADMIGDVAGIQSAGRNLLRLISDVLDITRMEAEKLDLQPECFDVMLLALEVAEAIRPLVQKNGNALELAIEAEGVRMYADVTRVRQVLLNVLGNAAKFTERGQVRLGVAVRPGAPGGEGPLVTFEVADTGIGMTPEQQGLLFKDFVQLDDSPTRAYGGSGLGLAISYRLCTLMGGTIRVTSEPGAGSTFTVELPLRPCEPPPA